MAKVKKMSLKYFTRMSVMAFGILGAESVAGTATPSAAEESYPWCVQGSVLHCYYMTREQCEMTVDYHGFCVANPDVLSQSDDTARRS
jgi:Protein of unknown function (DUF3551)